jgi:hypothetical protein
MRSRVSKIDKCAIAHISRNESVKPGYNGCYAAVVSGDDFTQILWIKAGTERCRANQIDEHDGQLPMFGDSLTMLARGQFMLFGEWTLESRTAGGTESFFGRIFASAGLTLHRKRRAAVATKIRSARHGRPTTRARHAILLGDSRTLSSFRLLSNENYQAAERRECE